MRFSLLVLTIIFFSCVPEQEGVEFGVTIKPQIGADGQLQTKEDQPTRIEYKVEKTEESIDLTVVVSKQPKYGKLDSCQYRDRETIECIYYPLENFNGFDEVYFKAKDGDFLSNEAAKVVIEVLPVPDAPLAPEKSTIKLPENSAHDFNVNKAQDIDSQQLTYEIISPPTHGTLSGCLKADADMSCTYEPDPNYFGKDQFTYRAIDETGLVSETAEVELHILNYPEVSDDQEVQAYQYESKEFEVLLAQDADTSEVDLSYYIVKAPSNGTLGSCFQTKGQRKCTYTPNGNFFGEDQFTYAVKDSDGLESLNSAQVNFIVNKVNIAPVPGANQSLSLTQNTVKDFEINQASDQDSDNSKLVYSVVSPPSHGTVTNCLGTNTRLCKYTPNPSFYGVDSLTYKVIDDQGRSSSQNGVITFNVKKAYQKPVAFVGQVESLLQGTKKAFEVKEGTDIDTPVGQLKYAVVTPPKNGILTNCFGQAGVKSCEYEPNKMFTGEDSFEYVVVDDKGLKSTPTSLKFNIAARKYPEVSNILQVDLYQFDKKIFEVPVGSDADTIPLELTYQVVNPPKNGVLRECFVQKGERKCLYEPKGDYVGDDSFTYKIIDDYGLASKKEGIVDIVVLARKKPLAHTQDNFNTTEEKKITFDITAATDEDSDASKLDYIITEAPKNGLLYNCFVTSGHKTCTYQPNNNFYGEDIFKYKVKDEYGLESDNVGKVLIVVEKKLPPVVGKNDKFVTKENTPISFNVSVGSDDKTPVSKLNYTIVDAPLNGSLSGCFLLPGKTDCTYSPNRGYYGTDKFTYQIVDEDDQKSAIAQVEIVVEAVNSPPQIGAAQVFNLDKNAIKQFEVSQAKDSDTDANLLKYVITSAPIHGQLSNCFVTQGNRNCTYTPNYNYYGTDELKYKVVDDLGEETAKEGIIYFNIVNVNSKPRVGDNQIFTFKQGGSVTFVVNEASDKDSSADQLTYKIVDQPKYGTLLNCFVGIGKRQCTYTPSNKLFYGEDSFTYIVEDETGYSSELKAQVVFKVEQRKAPIVSNITVKFKQYTNVTFDVKATDEDSSLTDLQFVIETQPKHGVLSNCFLTKGYTSCTYTPTNNYYGLDSFSYNVVDEYNNKSKTPGVVSIVVEKVNLKPTIGADQSFTLDQYTFVDFEVSEAKDQDTLASNLTYKVVDPPKNGVLQNCFGAAGKRTCKYVPNPTHYGADFFTYKVVDDTAKESVATARVSFSIRKVDLPPQVGANQNFSTYLGKEKAIIVSEATDLDGLPSLLQYQIVTQPKNGKLVDCFQGLGDRNCKYVPNFKYYGNDEFTYKVIDDTGLSSKSQAKVSIEVIRKLERPVVGNNITISLLEGTYIDFSVPIAFDADSFAGDLEYKVVNAPKYGTLSNCLPGPGIRTCTYTPKPTFNGRDSFTYEVIDDTNLKSTTNGVVNINVTGKVYQGTETFSQNNGGYVSSVDIIWTIDNSGSMGNDQSRLASSFSSFMNNFLVNGKSKFPFNMLVTTSDKKVQTSYMGKLTSSKANSDFTTFKSNFQSAVNVGTGGSAREKMLESAYDTYSKHASWYGGNDTLAIFILVSDESEQSRQYSSSGWAQKFQSMKDAANKVRIYSVVNTDGDNRYADVSSKTGGKKYSLGSASFNSILNDISLQVSNMISSYSLNSRRKVDPNSITIDVNNTRIPSTQWRFSNGAILFTTPPAAGATIVVNYEYTNIYTGN